MRLIPVAYQRKADLPVGTPSLLSCSAIASPPIPSWTYCLKMRRTTSASCSTISGLPSPAMR